MSNTFKLESMARKLTSGEKCNVLFLGDSTAARGTSPRWSQSIIKKWNLDWREQVLYGSSISAPDEGFQTFIDPTLTGSEGDTLTDSTVVPAGFDVRYRDFSSNLSNFLGIHRLRASARQDYFRGDPWRNQALRWRLATLGTSDPVEKMRRQDLHDGGSASFATNISNATAADGTWQSLDVTVPASSATGKTYRELLLDTAFGFNETGKQYSIGGYSVSASGKTDGVQMAHIAEGGFTVADHIPSALGGDSADYSDTERATKFNVMDSWPDVIIIQLGINMETAEANSIGGVWGANMRTLMDWHKDLATANSKTPPEFILINPWATDSSESRRVDIAAEIREIAAERNDTGVMDLYQQVKDTHGVYNDWQATYLADGVHQNVAGVEEFGELSWQLITQASTSPIRRIKYGVGLGLGLGL